jgi:glutathione synthase/RimK-type ligase-like ATP-grasp enzyme
MARANRLNAYVFSPVQLDERTRRVKGYRFLAGGGGWQEGWFPLPDVVYDRSFFSRREDYLAHRAAVRRLYKLKPFAYLGHGLKSKWEMYTFLRRDPRLQPYLPKTARMEQPEQAAVWLDSMGEIFLKPESGSQGCGTVKAQRLAADAYHISARDSRNCPLKHSFTSKEAFTHWLRDFIGNRKYLLQPYLALQDSRGEAWDIRALVQKNGQGLWELAGMAVRRGEAGSITSNIHGGGTALEADVFLAEQFGPQQAAEVSKKLQFLAARIPQALEAGNGRMAELGLDLGVDREGKVWIIEVNTKPGRSVFRRLSMTEASRRAETNPMAYARHLLACAPQSRGSRSGRVFIPQALIKAPKLHAIQPGNMACLPHSNATAGIPQSIL